MKTTKKKTPISKPSKPLIQDSDLSCRPVLRFSPTAWAKLLYFRDRSDNEIGGFGITEKEDLLYITDFMTVKQDVSSVSVRFDDEAVSAFFEQQVDNGRHPEQFARVWLHTHPGSYAEPSAVDEETFKKVFGACHWAVMAILAEDNAFYARLSFHIGPHGQVLIPAEVDYSRPFGPSDSDAWENEYKANITIDNRFSLLQDNKASESEITSVHDLDPCAWPEDMIEQFEMMSPAERQAVLDELAQRPELWDEEEVMLL